MIKNTIILAALAAVANADPVTLLNENFANGTATGNNWTSANDGRVWSSSTSTANTTVSGFEAWTGTDGATTRGLSTTYDHDNNPATPEINVVGGCEVTSYFTNSGGTTNMLLTTQVTLPMNLDTTQAGSFSFYNEERLFGNNGNSFPATYSIFNVTDGRFIVNATNITHDNTAGWLFVNQAVNFTAADLGDTLRISFNSPTGGFDNAGLEVTDVRFNAFNTVPEPSVAILGGLGALALLRRRRA